MIYGQFQTKSQSKVLKLTKTIKFIWDYNGLVLRNLPFFFSSERLCVQCKFLTSHFSFKNIECGLFFRLYQFTLGVCCLGISSFGKSQGPSFLFLIFYTVWFSSREIFSEEASHCAGVKGYFGFMP